MKIETNFSPEVIPMHMLLSGQFGLTIDGWIVFPSFCRDRIIALTPEGINGFSANCSTPVTPLPKGTKITITV